MLKILHEDHMVKIVLDADGRITIDNKLGADTVSMEILPTNKSLNFGQTYEGGFYIKCLKTHEIRPVKSESTDQNVYELWLGPVR